MSLLSTLRPLLRTTVINNINNAKTTVPFRAMSGGPRVFPLQPSRWQWNKFKDLLHFYAMIGLIPVAAVVTYANIFIGPATLSEIPDGYTPKYWEYHRHPITRFLLKYIYHNPQQEYEKYLHHIYEEDEKRKMRGLEKEIKQKMSERRDFQSYYYRPILAKYHRQSREASEYLTSIHGD